VVDHAEVGALVGSGRAHGVGEERAADGDGVAPRGGARDEGLDIAIRDGGFNEDGLDFARDEKIDDALDVAHAGLGFGADALDADDLEAEAAAEVVEGVVGGDEDALPGRNGGEDSAAVVVEAVELREVALGVRLV